MWQKIKQPSIQILKLFTTREAIVIITAIVALIISQKHSQFDLLPENMALTERRVFEGLWYLLIPGLISIFVLRENPLKYGLIGADHKNAWFYFGLMMVVIIPLVFIAAKIPQFVQYYPQYKPAIYDWKLWYYYEISMFIYFIGWEYLYRGFMLFSLREKLGDGLAILVQMLPFAVLHLRKPEIEGFASILAGIILGVIALRSRSVWPCIMVHISAQATMDYLAILHRRALDVG